MTITVKSAPRTSSPPRFREKDAVCIEMRATPQGQWQPSPQAANSAQLAGLHIIAQLMGQAQPSASAIGSLQAYNRIGAFLTPPQSSVRI